MPDPSTARSPTTASRRRFRWVLAGAGLLVIAATVVWLARPVSAEQRLAAARAAVEAGDPDRAAAEIAAIRRARQLTDDELWLDARVERARNHPDQALASLDAIPDPSPLAAQARELAGQIEIRRKRMRPAVDQFQAALRLDPRRIQARRELVYIYGMQLRRQELGANFRAMGEQTALSYDDVFLWCLSRGNNWEAREHSALLREFLEADPADRWTRLAYAASLIELNQLDAAGEALEPLPADDPAAHAARVRLALARGDPVRAEQLLAEAPADDPALARQRGQLALARGDAPAALAAYRVAEAADPDHRDAIFGLGRALQLAGQSEAARPYLERARQLDELATLVQRAATPEGRAEPELPLRLGAACEAVGRLPEARAWYKVAISRNPLDTAPQQALFRVEKAISAQKPRQGPPASAG